MQKEFQPPQPVGEPYRADPADPFPFPTEADAPPRHEPPSDLPAVPRWSHPPTHSQGIPGAVPPVDGGADSRPQFRQPGDVPPGSPGTPIPVSRQARVALWIGIASIFVFNIFLGPMAIVLGIRAVKNGEKQTGQWAIATGIAGTLIGILVMVLVATGVMPSLDEMLKDLREGR